MSRPFEIGDRVRARVRSPVPAGTLGRVAQTLISSPDMYFVQFDGEERWTLMRVADLELVTEADEDYF
jgi:hypothetical protein